jgi:AraC family transcriptional regulator, arabinose operon regulatory protein
MLRADGGQRTMSPGDTVVWTPGTPHDFGCRGDVDWELVWAHFRLPEQWHDWLTWPSFAAGIARIPAPPERLRSRIADALLEMDGYARSALYRSGDLAQNALERALLWLDAANPGTQQLDDRIREAVLFVAGNLDQPLTVRGLAEEVHLSPSRFAHVFRTQLGTPPARFIEQRRIERAQGLLESSSLSIGAVARTAGYASQYHFAARFKVIVGMSPSDWRRRARRRGSQGGLS